MGAMTRTALQTKPSSVIVKNVYYLMAYAFRVVGMEEYRKLGSEEFEGMDDLLAAVLLLGVEAQRRRGFERGYVPVEEVGCRIRGRVDLRRTMELESRRRLQVHCRRDDYCEDTPFNRILKAGVGVLLASGDVAEERRRRLKGALAYLHAVSDIDEPSRICWTMLRYDRNNRTYELLMSVCFMAMRRHLPRLDGGDLGLAMIDDEQAFSALFEHFLLEYYRRHFPQLGASSRRVCADKAAPPFVPRMLTDVSLSHGGRTLVIDAKCYGEILATNFGKKRLTADHVRQIYYYASHAGDAEHASGLLVYAGTGEADVRECWTDNGYRLGCRTLDLAGDFDAISAALDAIAQEAFGPLARRG